MQNRRTKQVASFYSDVSRSFSGGDDYQFLDKLDRLKQTRSFVQGLDRKLSARVRAYKASTPGGSVVYRGPSMIGDRSPVVGILTFNSANTKTGPMVQLWILPANQTPLGAVKSNDNRGACGSCPLQGRNIDGKQVGRTCYVNLGQAPDGIWHAWKRGRYPAYGSPQDASLVRLKSRGLRLGAYGDPAALPIPLLRRLVKAAHHHTGYTHQIDTMPRRRADSIAAICMVSVETAAQRDRMQARGYRTFYVVPSADFAAATAGRDIGCPFYSHGVTCDQCRLCGGSDQRAASIVVVGHGTGGANLAAAAAAE